MFSKLYHSTVLVFTQEAQRTLKVPKLMENIKSLTFSN